MRYLTLLLMLSSVVSYAQKKITISGYVKEKGSLELLIGANVYLKDKSVGTTTNTYGFYSLTIPIQQKNSIVFSFVGYQPIEKEVNLEKDLEINIELENENKFEEVVISAKKQSDMVSEDVQMSQIELPVSQIKKIPTLLGEKDVLRVLQLMPGVQKGTEGQTGIYVRGGGPDQNLIILDDANVYNANHLFGFFSVFNGDALKSVELTKGGFPARYGGRLSSVIDLNMKEGNKEKFSGEGGIGLISSKLTLEGPILKNKASFLISGRRTYADVLARPIIARVQANQDEKVNPGYFFYDLNMKLNWEINNKNKVYLSGYFGQDRFNVNTIFGKDTSQNGLNWGNATTTLRWNHLFNNKLFSNFSFIFTDYQFNIFARQRSSFNNNSNFFSLDYRSAIRDNGIKYDFDYFPNPNHSIKFGLQSMFHAFDPSAVVLQEGKERFNRSQKKIQAIESGLYAEDIWSVGNRLKINYGLRLSNYQVIGRTIWRPEPRVAAAFKMAKDISVKASFARMNQYIHLLSNSGLGLPTDLWVPSTKLINPQSSEQFAAGIAKDFGQSGISLTIEGYYKKMSNILNLKEGTNFTFFDNPEDISKNQSWENSITAGQGDSKGLEVLLQKKTGRFSGWVGYTWSKTQWQFDELNFGKPFFPRYDRRHDLSLVGIYELNKKITLSGSWVFASGNALTIPKGTFVGSTHYGNPYAQSFINGQTVNSPATLINSTYNPYSQVQNYTERNAFRAEPYHRLDLSIQFHKKKKNHERTWDFSAYNAYSRLNPFFYEVRNRSSTVGNTTTNKISLNRIALFPIIPSVSYNFKF